MAHLCSVCDQPCTCHGDTDGAVVGYLGGCVHGACDAAVGLGELVPPADTAAERIKS